MQVYRFHRVSTAWPLLVVLLPLTAGAQPANTGADASDGSGETFQLDPVNVTGNAATKTQTPFIETPQSVSRIDREDIEKKDAQTIQRAANYTPGAFTDQIGASNRYDYLVLRGFSDGSINNTHLDGLKVMGDSGSYSSMAIDPYFLESIEIVKGPASVLYGRASPGGLVSLNSKRPRFEREGEVELGLGNNEQRHAAFDVTGPVGEQERVAYRLTGLASAADTQFGPVKEERYAFGPSLTWDASEDTTLTLRAYLQHDPEGGYHSGLPYEGTVEPHDGITLDNEFYEGEPGYEKFERTQRQVGYALDHAINDTWTFRQNARYLGSDVELEQVYAFGWASATELTRFASGAEEDLTAWTIDNQMEGVFDTGAVQHMLLFGVDQQQRENDVVLYSGTASPLDATDPQYGGPVNVAVSQRSRRELQQTGLYLQDQMQIDNWHLMAGARNDWVDIENTDRDTGASTELDIAQASGRAGLLYRFDTGVAPYASYSTSFSPNATTNEDGDLLEPTEGKQFETGIKYQPPGTSDSYSIALFSITQENVSTKDPNESFYRAIGEIESEGVEIEADTQATRNLHLQAGYTYTDVVYQKTADATQGNTANQVPRDQANAWANYVFNDGALSGLDVGLGVRHYGDIYADEENTEQIPDYTLVDATLGYDLTHIGYPGFDVRVNVNNLADEEYIASCYDLNYCYYGEERNIRAELTYKF